MKAVVISQPMFFPWVGLLEQLRMADVWVHYDDVQFSKGSFTNRVQVKTAQGSQWLTVPLRELRLGQLIKDVAVDDRHDWRKKHLTTLAQAYAKAPHRDEMLALVEGVYHQPTASVGELAIASLRALYGYFGFDRPAEWLFSSQLGVGGQGSPRVLEIVTKLEGTRYITGHGASNYLDHEAFDRAGVRVEYLDYHKTPYPQLHGEFTPFVSALDLVANCGRVGREVIASGAVYWKDFVK